MSNDECMLRHSVRWCGPHAQGCNTSYVPNISVLRLATLFFDAHARKKLCDVSPGFNEYYKIFNSSDNVAFVLQNDSGIESRAQELMKDLLKQNAGKNFIKSARET